MECCIPGIWLGTSFPWYPWEQNYEAAILQREREREKKKKKYAKTRQNNKTPYDRTGEPFRGRVPKSL
jgi:hypothetical protein